MYRNGLRSLSAAESSILSNLRIVGLQYYNSTEVLKKAAEYEGPWQRLFLVREVNNVHDTKAVMLHNGVRKIGSLNREQAPLVRGLLESWKRGGNDEDVVVVEIDGFNMYDNSIFVDGIYRVQERLARKFAAEAQDQESMNKVLARANSLGW